MVDIRDDVGNPHYLTLQSARASLVLLGKNGACPFGVLQYPVAYFPGEVQPIATTFQLLDHAEALLVVAKSARNNLVKNGFSRMTKRGMSQIVPQTDRFRQVLVQPECSADGTSNLSDFQSVRQASAVMVTLRR